jgi:RNA polymerase sigma-70 factor, ECF subfamily
VSAPVSVRSREPERSDEELFARIAEGRLDALGALFDRHHAAVRAFVERMTSGAPDRDDLVQETFLAAARAAGSFEPTPSARPFLLGVAAQLLRRRRRSFARLRRLLAAVGDVVTPAPPDPEEATIARNEHVRVERAIAALADERREVFLLVELSGLSGVEAARALGVPAGTVWRRLHEARRELRRAMESSR